MQSHLIAVPWLRLWKGADRSLALGLACLTADLWRHASGKELVRYDKANPVNHCRNCGSAELQDLGPIGRIHPFFLKRAIGMEIRCLRTANAIKQKIRDLVQIPMSFLSRLTAQFAFVDMQLCRSCSFIQTAIPFHDDQISQLYVDYRSPSYNQQRIQYEPEYASIAAAVGYDPIEIRTRRTALTAFLNRHLQTASIRTVLDYGGSDGRFIPDIQGSKMVYEISNVDPIPGVTRIEREPESNAYSIVLLAHVTEHVTHPLKLVRQLRNYVEPGGYLYIETPQEISDQQRAELQKGIAQFDITIHEHINSYCLPAVSALLEAGGFEIIATQSAGVDIGWIQGTHLRALGRKAATA
jgi:Methyltransferase domain